MVRPEDLIHPRDAIMHAMGRVYRYRMTTTSGGNISTRDEDGTTWITPAGVDKGGLTREDIVRVRPDGATEGRHRPSSELPFHRAIYAARPDLRAIVHAHRWRWSPSASADAGPIPGCCRRPGGSASAAAGGSPSSASSSSPCLARLPRPLALPSPPRLARGKLLLSPPPRPKATRYGSSRGRSGRPVGSHLS